MAKEDIEDRSADRRVIKQESTTVDPITDEVNIPEFNTYNTNKKVANSKPIGCNFAGPSGHAPAVATVQLANGESKDLCARHWNALKSSSPEHIESYNWIPAGADTANYLRSERAKASAVSRGQAAAEEYIKTGIHNPVRSPGRPPVDSVTETLERAGTTGGHEGPDHKAKLDIAVKALQHANTSGKFDPKAYWEKSHELGLTNHADKEKYLGHAEAEIKRRLSTAGKKGTMGKLREDVARNYTTDADLASNELNELMQPDTPSAVQAGAAGIAKADMD